VSRHHYVLMGRLTQSYVPLLRITTVRPMGVGSAEDGFLRLLMAVIGAIVLTHPARSGFISEEKRVAFVVTNQEHEIAPLAFSHADGDIVSAALRDVG
jgi:hypothetical protein